MLTEDDYRLDYKDIEDIHFDDDLFDEENYSEFLDTYDDMQEYEMLGYADDYGDTDHEW